MDFLKSKIRKLSGNGLNGNMPDLDQPRGNRPSENRSNKLSPCGNQPNECGHGGSESTPRLAMVMGVWRCFIPRATLIKVKLRPAVKVVVVIVMEAAVIVASAGLVIALLCAEAFTKLRDLSHLLLRGRKWSSECRDKLQWKALVPS